MKIRFYKAAVLAAVLGAFTACSDDDSVKNDLPQGTEINAADLPQASRAFLSENFPNATVKKASKLDQPNVVGTLYLTTLSNNVNVDFSTEGNWTDIDGNGQEIPSNYILENIIAYIDAHYPDPIYIEGVDVENNGYEVELSNDVDLFFDLEGNFVAEDFDNGDTDDDEVIIAFEDLPQASRDLINTYFSDASLISIVKDLEEAQENEAGEEVYEVKLSNGIELGFDAQGNWVSIESHGTAIPADLVPQSIASYLQSHFDPSIYIEEIEKDEEGGFDVELSNNVELEFDAQGNLVSSDGDDDQDDNETIINASDLPTAAQDFISTNFSGTTIASATQNNVPEQDGTVYEVRLQNGVEIDFDAEGNWIDIDGNQQALPSAIIPQFAADYVVNTYPNLTITGLERHNNSVKVELSNGVDLIFDANGNLIRIDD